jgi:hypothetical protein
MDAGGGLPQGSPPPWHPGAHSFPGRASVTLLQMHATYGTIPEGRTSCLRANPGTDRQRSVGARRRLTAPG